MKKFLITYLLFHIISTISAQTITISGTVSDAETGEAVAGAVIRSENKQYGTASNSYGFYSVNIPAGIKKLYCNSIGYKEFVFEINGSKNQTINIELLSQDKELEEVTVTGKSADKNIQSAETGVNTLNTKDTKLIPVIFGEQDILKTIQLLPGIKSAGEGGSGFFVRGGGADENLILLDEASVYNASHLMGFFSVFNSDAVRNVKIYKGTAPAQYGGRLSSVLDIQTKEGNNKKFSISGGIGLISSRLTTEIPVVKNKSSLIISGRRTYADIFSALLPKDNKHDVELYFYDLNVKTNLKINNKNRIFLSGYTGRDVFGFDNLMSMNWGNITGTARWNKLFGNKLFLNTSLIYSKYDYMFGVGFFTDEGTVKLNSSVKDFRLKEDFQYFGDNKNLLRFGISSEYHVFLPGEVDASEVEYFNDIKTENKYAFENALYVSHEYEPLNSLKIIYGCRLSGFAVSGPGTVYEFDSQGEPVDSVFYKKNEIIKTYKNLEPRISLNYRINRQNAVKATYTRNSQYIHLLSNSTSSTPADVWYPTTKLVPPGISDLFSAGYYKNFKDNMFEVSAELYYKDLKNVIDYKNGANVMVNKYLEAELVFGTGRSYGVELYAKKQYGKFTGWISYTLSKTERKFDEINNGEYFPARHDRTHDFSITAIYKPGNRWSFAATWVYYTGDAVTFPSGRYIVDGRIVMLYTERNGYRMPDYHRGDISVTYYNKKKKHGKSSWNLSVYNIYARKNAYQISFERVENSTQFQAVRLSLFSIIPSVSYSFKFN
ncbi:MAG: TonB-dependent receptor [Chlorobi bacterium]|nr:TonB-dependent receptor [Chlorobiota bacterium]